MRLLSVHWSVGTNTAVDFVVANFDSFNETDVRVLAGEHDRETDSGLEQWRTIDRWVVHDGYDEDSFENDVAVIHVRPAGILSRLMRNINVVHVSLTRWRYCQSGNSVEFENDYRYSTSF